MSTLPEFVLPEQVALLCQTKKTNPTVEERTILVGASMLLELMLREEITQQGTILAYHTHPVANYDRTMEPYINYINNHPSNPSHLFSPRLTNLTVTILKNKNLITGGLFGEKLTPNGKQAVKYIQENKTERNRLAEYILNQTATPTVPALSDTTATKLALLHKYVNAYRQIAQKKPNK